MTDAGLTRLLQDWQGLTPPSDFEAGVWRRIESESGSESCFSFVFGLFSRKPRLGLVFRSLTAAAAGIMVGVGTVFFLFASSPSVAGPDLGSQLSPSRSLTKAYTEMVAGGGR